jgi:hypothetical protein
VVRHYRRRYLLDLWVERRVVESLPAIVRVRVRDLSTTGTGRYVGSFADVEAIIEADLDAEGVNPRCWERDRDLCQSRDHGDPRGDAEDWQSEVPHSG